MTKASRSIQSHILFIAFFGFVIVGLPSGTMNVLWRYIQSDLKVTFSALGTLLIITSMGGLIVSSYSGSIIARMGIARFLLIGTGLCLIGYGGFVLATSWNWLIASSVLMGFGVSALINSFNTFVATNFQSSRVNWLHASFGIGSMIGPVVVTLLVIDRSLPWQSAYILIAAAFATLLVLILLTRQSWTVPEETNEQAGLKTRSASMRETLRLSTVWIAIGVFFFSTGTEISTSQLTNTLFVDGRGYDAKMVSTWIGIFWLCFTASRLFTGFFIDRVDYRIFLRVCMLGTIVGGMLIALNLTPNVSFAGILLMGITIAPLAPTLFSNTPRQVGMNHAPNAIGFLNTGASLGLALPPAFASRLSESVGLELIPPFLIAMIVITFILHEALLYNLQRKAKPALAD